MSRPHYYLDAWCIPTDEVLAPEICVYGGSAGGVAAAVSAAEEGRSCLLLNPGIHLGGMTTGGLSYTDIGNAAAIGGFARRFYEALGAHYGRDVAWTFEPHVASEIIDRLVAESGVRVRHGEFVDDVAVERGWITCIRLRSGLQVKARVYIDTTYEGDLMARAGVPYTVGREGTDQFGEEHAGVRLHETHQFDVSVSPFVEGARRESGLLPLVNPSHYPHPKELPQGKGDRSIQAYNFRVCMTDNPELRRPFPKPQGYDRSYYVLAARWLDRTETDPFFKFDRITPDKTDTNNHGAVSTDHIGGSHAWPEADYRTRELIFQEHVRYQQGLHWFMANDPEVPEEIRSRYGQWGLSADEFKDTGGWPHQLYVREGRRMRADAVVTEHDCFRRVECDDPVGLAAYQMDSHNCNRLAFGAVVKNEGDVQIKLPAPYGISYRAIVPPADSCRNLLVPVCLSASHIAFGSIRMEPVFMVLGESAAVAADYCCRQRRPVQDVPYDTLSGRLRERGQILRSDVRNTARLNP